MDKLNFTEKQNGQVLNASEWNALAGKVDEIVEEVNSNEEGNISWGSISNKGNLELISPKHINLEPAYSLEGGEDNNEVYGDIQMKPGDDITLESSHRPLSKRNEITIKTTNGLSKNNKSSVKLQVKASDITLSTEGKNAEDSNVMNVNITTGNGKGYLKVRAQAIDLRCEENGGIALLPKGNDNQGHENKIKFEHNGGDGKEFGTFNSEKTSIFTDEYRFNENGIVYAVTRGPLETTYKEDGVTPKKIDYPTLEDDFKDIINPEKSCTWGDIIKFVSWAKANKAGKEWENLWSD